MKLFIEQREPAKGSKQIAGYNTYVYVVDDDGKKIDISSMVRSADVRLHLGEAVTSNLEVFVTGFTGTAELEKLIVKKIKPRNWWRRKWRDVTTFAHRDGGTRYA